jgi:hypothetical protein
VADAVIEGKSMRKEEDQEQPGDAKAEKPRSRPSRKPAGETEQDDNIGEDVLLGDSTLAKLNVSRKVDGDVPAAAAAPAPVVEKAEDKKPRARKPKEDSAEAAAPTEEAAPAAE